MPVIFPDAYKEECEKKFGIRRMDVIQTYTYPDKEQKLLAQGLKIYLYLKKIVDKYILVHGIQRGVNGNFEIIGAYKLKEELVTRAGTLEPLSLIKELANDFGLTIKVGNQTSKFIYNELIPTRIQDPTKLVQVSNPDDHSFMTNFLFRIDNQSNQNKAQCAIVFCLDTTNYLKYLGVK
ncbi:MAG TPA: hypothetical protein VJS91_09220 [Nitrososphaeraceae archaeon]|nr:hypothetical protein [Nitrososphaeraceae archaeon]